MAFVRAAISGWVKKSSKSRQAVSPAVERSSAVMAGGLADDMVSFAPTMAGRFYSVKHGGLQCHGSLFRSPTRGCIMDSMDRRSFLAASVVAAAAPIAQAAEEKTPVMPIVDTHQH